MLHGTHPFSAFFDSLNGEDVLFSVTLLTLCHMAYFAYGARSVIFIRFSLRYEIQHAVEVDNTR